MKKKETIPTKEVLENLDLDQNLDPFMTKHYHLYRGFVEVKESFLEYLNNVTESFKYDNMIEGKQSTSTTLVHFKDTEILIKSNVRRIIDEGKDAVYETAEIINSINYAQRYDDWKTTSSTCIRTSPIVCSVFPLKEYIFDYYKDFARYEGPSLSDYEKLDIEIGKAADIIANLDERVPADKRITRKEAVRKINKIIDREINISTITLNNYCSVIELVRTKAITELIENMMGVYKPDDAVNIRNSGNPDNNSARDM